MRMERRNAIQIGDLIRQAIEDAGSTATYNAQRVMALWSEVVGPTINRHTTARWVKGDEMHVVIASGVMKSEITFMAESILARLNELAGTTESPPIRRLIVH